MIRSNRIPKISLGLLAVAIVYLLAISGQPRMADGGLSGHEMYLPEKLLALAVPLSVFATMVIAAIRAGRAGSWLWLISCIFVWPLSLVYPLSKFVRASCWVRVCQSVLF